MTGNKQAGINGALRSFSKWFDDFLLEVAKPLAIVGFAMGTVDIFTRGGIATSPWFNVPWAIVQAVTIDGLFFAVWYRIAATRWTREKRRANILLSFVGLVLALVAMITNGILSLQQLQGIKDSISAMAWLGIDPTAFTVGRAVLVVFVSIMVAFVYYQRESGNSAGTLALARSEQGNSRGEQWGTGWNTVVPEWNSWSTLGSRVETPLFSDWSWIEHSGTVLEPLVNNSEQSRTIVEQVPEPLGRESRQTLLLAEYAENNDRDKIRIALSARMRDNRPINLVEVAGETGVLYSRVRKLAPSIKKELSRP